MVLRHVKLLPDAVEAKVVELERSVKRSRGWATAIFLVAAGITGAACFVVGPIALVATLFALIIYLGKRGKLARAWKKVQFTRELHALLVDELHPRRSVVLDFDLRHYDEGRSPVWSGRSVYGNRKYKYSDKWLHYRGVLADGTKLSMMRQAGIKTKKGAVVKEKRRLFLEIMPNPSRYSLSLVDDPRAARALRNRLQVATDAFHDTPEDFHARVQGGGRGLRVKVTQEDAPILAGEVTAIIEEVMRFLQGLRQPAAPTKVTLKKPEIGPRERA